MNTADLDIFRCPHCAPKGSGKLSAVKENWLSCVDCGRNYPLVQDIPVLIPEEGDKWLKVALDQLPDIDNYDRFQSSSS
jgi:uncharacterized protein YbaR (Trm112 family)